MNGNKTKRVLAALICAFMLIGCTVTGVSAANVAEEAIVFVKPSVVDITTEQIGKEIHINVLTEGCDTDHSVVVYFVDKNDLNGLTNRLGGVAHKHIRGNKAEVVIKGIWGGMVTGEYTIVAALNRADEVFKKDISCIGGTNIDNFFAAVNSTDETDVKEKLDENYHAMSVIKCAQDADGNVILKLAGEDYENLTDDTKDEFAKLIANGVNGKYTAAKGTFTYENSENFIKDAYVTAIYNANDVTYSQLADILYRFDNTIGFDGEDSNFYGKIENKETLAKVVKSMANKVDNVAKLQVVLEEATAVQLINETYYLNLVNVIAANNDKYYQVSQSDIARLSSDRSDNIEFCELFKGEYYSLQDIRNGWNNAMYELDNGSGGGGVGGGTGGGKVTEHTVNTQISMEENKKDPNVEIKDYYTDMSDTYSWASDAVLNLTKAQIVSGYGDKTYRPGNSVTRAEFMKMVVNVFGLADITATSSFADVNKDAWYYIYVASAEKLGVAQGYGNGLFGVNDSVTRQDALTIIYRAAKVKGVDLSKFYSSSASLVDRNEIAQYAVDAVEALYNTGVFLDATDPKSIDKLEPTRNASRAYLSVVLNQVYNYMK